MSVIRFLILMFCCGPAPATAGPYFVHCYDFGCKSSHEVRFNQAQWDQIEGLFNQHSLNVDSEKQVIRQAIAMMESFSGAIAGTHRDKAGNYPGYDIIKQMDCIDESTNTFQYLSALEELKLLKWHRIEPKKRRIVWLVTHWTAVIAEIEGERKFAVDSWYRDNGEMPYIQPLSDWERKRDFPAAYNPELGLQ